MGNYSLKNIGTIERIIRFILGIILFWIGFITTSPWEYLAVLSPFIALSAVLGFSPTYLLLEWIKVNKKQKSGRKTNMSIWHDIPDDQITPEKFVAVIEIPKGTKTKYEMDKPTGMLKVDRILYTSTHYPANYGFIPKTLADDGDPLDVLVLCTEQLEPMSLVECYPIGAFSMIDKDENDEKIIAIPFEEPQMNQWKSIADLPKHIYLEIQHFFSVYKELEHSETSIQSVEDVDTAKGLIEKSMGEYKIKFGAHES